MIYLHRIVWSNTKYYNSGIITYGYVSFNSLVDWYYSRVLEEETLEYLWNLLMDLAESC